MALMVLTYGFKQDTRSSPINGKEMQPRLILPDSCAPPSRVGIPLVRLIRKPNLLLIQR